MTLEHDCTCDNKDYTLDKDDKKCLFSSTCKICGKEEMVTIRSEPTSPKDDEIVFITPENFPVGTRILAYSVGWSFGFENNDAEEFICEEWSPNGRCKVYNVLTRKYFWTSNEPNIRIMEIFPGLLDFEFPKI